MSFASRTATWLRRPFDQLRTLDWQSGALSTVAATLRPLDKRAVGTAGEPFDELEKGVVTAFASTVCAHDDPDLPPVDGEAIGRFVEDYALGLPKIQATMLRNLLLAFEFQPLVYGPKRKKFTQLTDDERRSNLEAWAATRDPQRQAVFKSLKTVCMLAYWSNPETWEVIGYDGPTAEPGYDGGNKDWDGAEL